jgi:hypothetical protein
LTTAKITEIDLTSVKGGGNITFDGNSEISARGISYSPFAASSIYDKTTSDGTGAGLFTSLINGLSPATHYYARAYATNSAGTQYGQTVSFFTAGSAPTISDYSASDITTTSAKLHARVNSMLISTIVTFEYGHPFPYIFSAPAIQNPLSQNDFVDVSADLKDLLPFTMYQFRVKAVNRLGTTYCDGDIFWTSGWPPTIRSWSLTDVTMNSVNVRAIINPGLLESSAIILYGPSETFADSVAFPQNPLLGNSDIDINRVIDNLNPGTKYYFRIKSVNQAGTTYGNELSCITNN